MEENKGIPRLVPIFDYRIIRLVRTHLGMTIKDFSKYVEVDSPCLSRLERGLITYTPHYQKKVRKAIQRLDVTPLQLVRYLQLLEEMDLQQAKGRNHN